MINQYSRNIKMVDHGCYGQQKNILWDSLDLFSIPKIDHRRPLVDVISPFLLTITNFATFLFILPLNMEFSCKAPQVMVAIC